MTRASLTFTLALTSAAWLAAAQPPAPPAQPRRPATPADAPQRIPPRDAVQRPAVGTGRITGRVLAADTGAPLRRAQVRLSGQGLGSAQAINTDAEGNFTFANLPAGSYRVMAQKVNFLAQTFGQKRVGVGPGKAVVLTDGQAAERIDFALTRAGVISGRVVDDVGEPVPSVSVQAIRPPAYDGQPVRPMNSVQTDDLGQFRLHGLQPGEYIVGVSPRSLGMMGGAESIDRSGYAQTFFPGVSSMADAQRVQVQAGLETPNVSIGLVLTRLAQISGIVMAPAGAALPGGGSVQVRTVPGMPMFGGGSSSIRPDGTFVINNVAPGSYNLEVRTGGPEPLFATASVSVSGEDVPNIALMVSPGATIKGKIVFEGGEPPAYRQNIVTVGSSPLVPGEMAGPSAQSKTFEDWTFELRGLFGRRMLRANSAGWTLKSITLNGADVTDSGVEFRGSDVVGAFEIKFTKATTSIDATVTEPNGQPANDVLVLVYATDRAKWTTASRYIRMAYPTAENQVIVNGLPPGDYYVVAIEPIESGFDRNPQVLEQLTRTAERITLFEGEKKVLQLRYSPQ